MLSRLKNLWNLSAISVPSQQGSGQVTLEQIKSLWGSISSKKMATIIKPDQLETDFPEEKDL